MSVTVVGLLPREDRWESSRDPSGQTRLPQELQTEPFLPNRTRLPPVDTAPFQKTEIPIHCEMASESDSEAFQTHPSSSSSSWACRLPLLTSREWQDTPRTLSRPRTQSTAQSRVIHDTKDEGRSPGERSR